MRVNYMSAHRLSDQKALGVYRVIATVLTFTLLVFQTIYEAAVNKHCFLLTFGWWVSLWTLLFLGLSLMSSSAYFGDKALHANMSSDGTHPFYFWKIVTFIYMLAMLGGLHLMILILFDTYHSYAKVELLTHIGPFLLMMGDALFNRVYMPVGMMFWYAFGAYAAAAFYSAYMSVGF